ncbi:non-ribosomal peptide synthetase [Roseofilum sp. Belize Diploria]|uniref:non-ribosomal peptide synthetase n=1 Tax=Roseofilum sp. Belize Diploria TaxID=2821501 RepID=UPI001B23A151|nr:non-ribosomal peptide synthetase [Roseofilum sp. Belize Diploria]MBP0007663.1 amino acid adenylation domain-containing protein [Roseofilum sp. Belize Diploria]
MKSKENLSTPKRELLEKLLQGKVKKSLKSEQEKTVSVPQIVPDRAGRYEAFPLTEMQQAYWLGRSGAFELGNVSMHNYLELEAKDFDFPRFQHAWQQLIDRHDMLRAVVLSDGRQQVLESPPPYEIALTDLRDANETAISSHIQAVRDRLSHQVLPLDRWPQFEVVATQLSDRDFRLHLSLDGWCTDFWSTLKLFQDLSHFYNESDSQLPALELSFRDYVLGTRTLEETPRYEKDLTYWRDRISHLPPAPELPLAQNPGNISQPRFKRLRAVIDSQKWQTLKQKAARRNLTPTGLLLATYAEVLARWSKSPHFTLNVPSFNRLPFHPQINEIIGECASFILLEVNCSPNQPFAVRARRLQEQLWQDLEHGAVSGVRVLREWVEAQQREASLSAMPIIFTHGPQQSETNPTAIAFLEEQTETVYSISQTPQVWLDYQYYVRADGSLDFNWDYVEGLFPPGTIEDMFETYQHLLDRLADKEETWEQQQLHLIPVAQLAQRTAINATEAIAPEGLLHQFFSARARQQPQHPALVTSDRVLTYEEVSRRACQLSRDLRQLGVRPHQMVAVVMEKGWEQMVAVLAILAAGGTYVPIAPTWPERRQQKILTSANVTVALTQSHLQEHLAGFTGVQWLLVDKAELADDLLDPDDALQEQEDLAYVIYTSGSTGEPKGVAIDHRGAVNTIIDINQRFQVTSGDRVFALSALTFDLSVYDIFGVLAAGGTLVIPKPLHGKNPAHWLELIQRERVTLWNTVPALMEMLAEYVSQDNDSALASLRLALLSGDWIPLSLPDRLHSLMPDLQVVSLGGATEASIWSIFYPIEAVDPQWQSIPYGKSLTNQKFYVLDEFLEPVPVWVAGQLYIGGIGLAQGYWEDREKTEASFIIHPATGERLYRTGDLGRYLRDGNIEFLGREDNLVKLQGYRLELGEIEVALRQHPGVRDALVMVKENVKHQLAAYLICQSSPEGSLFAIEDRDESEIETAWRSLLAAGDRETHRILPEFDLDGLAETGERLEALSIAYMRQTFKDLGVYTQAGESYSSSELIEQCGLLPDYDKTIRQWLSILTNQGDLICEDGDRWISPKPLNTDNLQQLWQNAAGLTDPISQDLLSYLQRNGEHHIPILRGEKNPVDLLFIQGSQETAESAYERSPSARYSNNLVKAAVAQLVRTWPQDKPLRILEIGAGVGATTCSLLPELPIKNTRYTYTDISQFFLNQGRQKFKNYPFVEYRLFDVNRDPQEQGYELGSFDLILAVNVIHVARDLNVTLPYTRSLLAAGGSLLLVELTDFRPSHMTTIGLTEGFRDYKDERLSANLPTLSPQEWCDRLSKQGFEDCAFFPKAGSPLDILGQHVILARGDGEKQFKRQALQAFLQERLPDYAIPTQYIPLDRWPLTANGKINRQKLINLEDITSSETRSIVPPSNELEEAIAKIWQGVLNLEPPFDIQQNFFDLGGNSIAAVQVRAQLAETLKQDISVLTLFEYPTIESLARHLGETKGSETLMQTVRDRGDRRKQAALKRRQKNRSR